MERLPRELDEHFNGEERPQHLQHYLQLESNRVPSGQANSRRALGDIGNLVEVLSTRRNVIKDGLQDNPHGAAKNFPVVNRPVTRKSAEALASNQQLKKDTQVIDEPNENVPWGAKQQRTQSFSRNNHHQKHEIEGSVVDYMEDQITADLNETRTEDNEAVMNSFTAPNEGMHECCEVEMEDQDDPMPDIDEADAGNPMAVAEYVQDIYGFYKQSENLSCVPPDYMSHQTDINEKMRAILIDWLIEGMCQFDGGFPSEGRGREAHMCSQEVLELQIQLCSKGAIY